MSEFKQECASCANFLPIDDESGECRRYPPTVIGDSIENITVYPVVDPTCYCGEFKLKVH